MIKKKIVFVTYGAGHVNMLVPIIKKLQKKKSFRVNCSRANNSRYYPKKK